MELNRRDFVAAAAVAACGCVTGCQQDGSATGPKDPDEAEALQKGNVDLGTAQNYPQDGAYDRFIKSDRLVVVRQGNRISAISAICTHRACNVKPVEGDLRCPCHGSRFDLKGQIVKGPGDNELPHYAVTLLPNGHLVADKSKKVAPGAQEAAAVIA